MLSTVDWFELFISNIGDTVDPNRQEWLKEILYLAQIGESVSNMPRGYIVEHEHSGSWTIEGPDLDTRRAESLDKVLRIDE